MKRLLAVCVGTLLALSSAEPAFADMVETSSERKFEGVVVRLSDARLYLETGFGRLSFRWAAIKNVELVPYAWPRDAWVPVRERADDAGEWRTHLPGPKPEGAKESPEAPPPAAPKKPQLASAPGLASVVPERPAYKGEMHSSEIAEEYATYKREGPSRNLSPKERRAFNRAYKWAFMATTINRIDEADDGTISIHIDGQFYNPRTGTRLPVSTGTAADKIESRKGVTKPGWTNGRWLLPYSIAENLKRGLTIVWMFGYGIQGGELVERTFITIAKPRVRPKTGNSWR